MVPSRLEDFREQSPENRRCGEEAPATRADNNPPRDVDPIAAFSRAFRSRDGCGAA